MSISVEYLRTRLPEFANELLYSNAFVQMHIDDTLCEMDLAKWGCWADRGQAYLAAHYMTVAKHAVGGEDGDAQNGLSPLQVIASESEGDTSVSYQGGTGASGGMAGAGTDEMLATTLYGRQYIEFRSKCSPRGMSTAEEPMLPTFSRY